MDGWYRVRVDGLLYGENGHPKTLDQAGSELLTRARNAELSAGRYI